jgi:hypothetical protein
MFDKTGSSFVRDSTCIGTGKIPIGTTGQTGDTTDPILNCTNCANKVAL